MAHRKSGNAYSGRIVGVAAGVENHCAECKQPGTLTGRWVVRGLQPVEGKEGRFDKGTITDSICFSTAVSGAARASVSAVLAKTGAAAKAAKQAADNLDNLFMVRNLV